MGLADELKTLQELHEKGKLTDQEYADAKARTLMPPNGGQVPEHVLDDNDRGLFERPAMALVILGIVLLGLLGLLWYYVGTKNTTQLLATAVHAPITLEDEVENLPASSVKSLGFNVPYNGTVAVTMQVIRGNPIDVCLTGADQLAAIQENDWNKVNCYTEFGALKTTTYRRSGELGQGRYYLAIRDTSLGILSSSASDISVRIQVSP